MPKAGADPNAGVAPNAGAAGAPPKTGALPKPPPKIKNRYSFITENPYITTLSSLFMMTNYKTKV